jgi:hypothetical protein
LTDVQHLVQRFTVAPDEADPSWVKAKQIWIGAARGLEIHFVLEGEAGAICFRTGGSLPDAMRMHWRFGVGQPHLDKCPVIDYEPCWIETIDVQTVNQAAANFADDTYKLWDFLQGVYLGLTT